MAAIVVALVSVALAASVQADPANYGIESVHASLSTSQAGDHSDFTIDLTLKTEEHELPAKTRDISIDLPQGLLANPIAAPRCSAVQFVGTDVEDKSNATGCPQDSQVGITHIIVANKFEGTADFVEPVFNLQPAQGEPARLGFIALTYPILIDTELRPDYGITSTVRGADSLASLLESTTTLWGVPADEGHDEERLTPYEAVHSQGAIETPDGKRQSGLAPVPFMSNPTRCGDVFPIRATATSYQLPEQISEGFTSLAPAAGCVLLDFNPDVSVKPTTANADSASGLDVSLTFPTDGFEQPNLLIEAEQRKVEVVLPEGVSVNPSQAAGLGVCSEAELARETASSPAGAGCPLSSKIGTVAAKSPLLEEPAEGSLFLAKPYQNPFGTLLAIYLVVKVPDRGVAVKLSGKVMLDPDTGQLVTTFDDIPQLPVSSFKMHLREGTRSPLVTPSTCGIFTSTATFTSWAEQVVTVHPSFEISRGVGGGLCQSGTPPFEPGFEAGTLSNSAASFSPLYMRLTRRDGDQNLVRFSSTLPPGVLAKLAGVSRCPDQAIETAKAKSGEDELAAPSCPLNSEVGHLLAGAGVGPALTYVPGKIYFAGPYQGAPLSVVAIVPAVAGPFDLGTVVVREALALDPETAEVQIDGSRSEPLPRILAGIPLNVRDVRVYVDRPDFVLNPTNCDPETFRAQIWGGGIEPFSETDDVMLPLATRFQASNCSQLGFRPRLSLRLVGGTRRGSFPSLRAVLRPRAGDANISAAQITLPHSAFIEQNHFRTICTRTQFAAHQCPAGSIYGHVRAFSPLLDEPLEGPVYLRSSDHVLPDLVISARGIVEANTVGRIDSVKGRLRSNFESIPDAPLSKVVLTMQGGKKGLFVNSTNICSRRYRATVRFIAQNGKAHDFNPTVRAGCDKQHHTARHTKQP
jgi:hypothetical protein